MKFLFILKILIFQFSNYKVIRTQGLIATLLIQTALSTSVFLVDYLVPPPPSPPNKQQTLSLQTSIPNSESIGFMQKIAKWFSFKNYSTVSLPSAFNFYFRNNIIFLLFIYSIM